MKILIIIPYFGDWPPWFSYFLQTCEANPSFSWLLYSDCKKPKEIPPNIRIIQKNLSQFNQLASRKLNLKINIRNPYKICDLRPSFGEIFEDFTKNFDFWGYSDLDLFYGNIGHFITNNILKEYDLISVRKYYLTGHFALYRNTKIVNTLYKKGYQFKKIFEDNNYHYAFDERLNNYGKKLFNPLKNRLIRKTYSSLETKINKIRSKIKPRFSPPPSDMTSIAKLANQDGIIRYYSKDLVCSDLWFLKHGVSSWKIIWETGKLHDTSNQNELLHFHIIESKKNKDFKISKWEPRTSFTITEVRLSTSNQ